MIILTLSRREPPLPAAVPLTCLLPVPGCYHINGRDNGTIGATLENNRVDGRPRRQKHLRTVECNQQPTLDRRPGTDRIRRLCKSYARICLTDCFRESSARRRQWGLDGSRPALLAAPLSRWADQATNRIPPRRADSTPLRLTASAKQKLVPRPPVAKILSTLFPPSVLRIDPAPPRAIESVASLTLNGTTNWPPTSILPFPREIQSPKAW